MKLAVNKILSTVLAFAVLCSAAGYIPQPENGAAPGSDELEYEETLPGGRSSPQCDDEYGKKLE